jgi:hypothetical protein
MTDNYEEVEEEQAQPEGNKTPEVQTFEVTTVRAVEVDFTERQLKTMKKQTDSETAKEAIETIFLQRSTQQVEPQQKLIHLNVDINEPSDE